MKLTRHEYTTDGEKRRDFAIGFVGWWIVNLVLFGAAVLFGAVAGRLPDQAPLFQLISLVECSLSLLPWVVTLGGLIFFAFTRTQIALGALVAIGVLLGLVVILGVLFAVACFVTVFLPNR